MILRAEPRQIMRFVEDNFEILRDLYQVQLKEHLIPADSFQAITRHKGDTITRRITDYKLIRGVGDDYRMAEQVGNYLGFLTQEFKPMLPEQLRRYYGSIRDIYALINVTTEISDEDRTLRLEKLYDEIQSFLDNVTNNTYTLLQRTQRLKINRRQLTYSERIREANRLISHYIDPLTSIIDLGNTNSIARLLQRIGKDINLDRLNNHAPTVLDRYQQLDQLLRQVNGHLLREADVIRRELTPLIDRIQRESEVLSGFLVFLEQPLLTLTPVIGQRHKQQIFGNQTQADLRIYVEQFIRTKEQLRIDLRASPIVAKTSVFNRSTYRRKLEADLPLDNFFDWCEDVMSGVSEAERERYLLSLISLLFSGSERYVLTFFATYRLFPVAGFNYRLPQVAVAKVLTSKHTTPARV